MEQLNFSVGLDIGTTKIVALVGKKNEYNKVEILGLGKSKSLGVHRGVVNNITQTIKKHSIKPINRYSASWIITRPPWPIISVTGAWNWGNGF